MNLGKDTFNLIITGVGGQGNVVSSVLLGEASVNYGFQVSIGETYGASQRGGAVMSHVRISKSRRLGPLVPKGSADVILGLEPIETLRVTTFYGNPSVLALVNMRPIYPVGVTLGKEAYPEEAEIKDLLTSLCGEVIYIDAIDAAMRLGSPILVNMVMIGALLKLDILPFPCTVFIQQVMKKFCGEVLSANLKAIEEGRRLMQLR